MGQRALAGGYDPGRRRRPSPRFPFSVALQLQGGRTEVQRPRARPAGDARHAWGMGYGVRGMGWSAACSPLAEANCTALATAAKEVHSRSLCFYQLLLRHSQPLPGLDPPGYPANCVCTWPTLLGFCMTACTTHSHSRLAPCTSLIASLLSSLLKGALAGSMSD
jgi:hypothetical protein